MDSATRIKDKKIAISDDRVKEFFDKRCEKKLPYRYNYTNYQDDNPELALERDRQEKEKIFPLLGIKADCRALDIGCGVGRWGDAIVKELSPQGKYIGIDYSQKILDMADQHFSSQETVAFYCASFQNFPAVLPPEMVTSGFDLIIINGVLMYVNDADIPVCIANADKCLKPGGTIFIKETVGLAGRLTLKGYYSEELAADYSAIYRKLEEYDILWKKYFIGRGYEALYQGETWPSALKNRRETASYYWIVKKGIS